MFILQRVHAFAVTPQRGTSDQDLLPPEGGAIKLTAGLRDVIQAAFVKIDKSELVTVDLTFDANRMHDVRADILAVAFGATTAPRAAATRLATRLSKTMDGRSHSALLILVVEAEEIKRRVSLLVFPREDVIQLGDADSDEYLLNILHNAFATGSALRKLARLEGHQTKAQFLSAEILDFQLSSNQKMTADFWIKDFLAAQPRIDITTGTRSLVAALQRALDAAQEDDYDAIFAATFKASSGMISKTSLSKYAETEIPEQLRSHFLRGISDETAKAIFELDRQMIREKLGRRIITAQDGVVISAPVETIGNSVSIEQRGGRRIISYKGLVSKERIARSREANSSSKL